MARADPDPQRRRPDSEPQRRAEVHRLAINPGAPRAAATRAFSFIAPDLCNDGHDAPCVTRVRAFAT